ncbi:peptide-methionine (S)-S-oxide reductase MsrA [Alpinimonas psychrophila]|uniref:Peptide methionine sulfoxide reductase MsrA n=1 Tax=Alpinimonas psychrophila TaxID=748908 RepID=A0A7W3JT80_9MICO|nr:peptide-methionine (S)-S-oxide reductase MsrA [Alpinimonas psychrophila]MBA8828803.1 peptide-methionine (S)-S-oxide reductase [Alpinimonas psychrophila]
MHTFVLAGGCFWCLDAVYRTLNGVSAVVSGYIGGEGANPSYEEVCTGLTGHVEAVAVTFDPAVIPDQVILDVFFSLHDPTQLNRQGNDVGTQYRSAMFPADDAQRELFEKAIALAATWWDAPVVTTIEPLGAFYEAEEYHQDFFARNPGQGYCLAVALPKVNKIRKSFAPYIKD